MSVCRFEQTFAGALAPQGFLQKLLPPQYTAVFAVEPAMAREQISVKPQNAGIRAAATALVFHKRRASSAQTNAQPRCVENREPRWAQRLTTVNTRLTYG